MHEENMDSMTSLVLYYFYHEYMHWILRIYFSNEGKEFDSNEKDNKDKKNYANFIYGKFTPI